MRISLFILIAAMTQVGQARELKLFRTTPQVARELADEGFHPISDHYSDPLNWVGYLSDEEWNRLSAGKRNVLQPLDEGQWAAGAYDRFSFSLRRVNLERRYESYHDYDSLTRELLNLAEKYPHLVQLKSAGKSVQGRELWYVIVSDRPLLIEHEPKFIYHANMHGDEVVGRELMIYFLRHLLENHGKDTRITQLVDHSEIFIMPSMNPDGYELRTRANAKGYDLNRNFPDRFDSPSDTPDGRQIEVQRMMELARTNHFVYGINWHGGEICFNLPWGNIKNTAQNKYEDDSFFNPIGREYTEFNRPMHQNHHGNFDHGLTYGWEWYPVSGGINDWFNYYRRSVHSVIELSKTKWPSSDTLTGYWNDNREAMITYLWRGLRGIHLHVVDSNGRTVPEVSVSTDYSKRVLVFDEGYVNRLGPEGNYKVRVRAPGFQEAEVSVQSRYFDGNYVEVKLQPDYRRTSIRAKVRRKLS